MNTYRNDIDGLRAISALVIVFFHLRMTQFTGGFIGVDIFFVISGFLISGTILQDLSHQSFSFKQFYVRRIARILPALLVTVAFTLAAATFILLPDALVMTGKQSIAAVLSLSNVFFWQEISYWSPAAESQPLLHTWSLGVEEQFYLLYPLILFLSFKLGGKRLTLGVLILLSVLSYLLTHWHRTTEPTAAFYLTHYRFYEFAVGGLGAMFVARYATLSLPRWAANLAATIALIAILYAAVQFHEYTLFLQSGMIFIPLAGALLLLLLGPSDISERFLGNGVMVWLGKISYALYLVHWPIISLYRYHYGDSLSILEKIILFIAILAVAELLNRSVERRLRLMAATNRTRGNLSSGRVLAIVGGMVLGIAAYAGATVAQGGWPSRLPPEAQSLLKISPMKDRVRQKKYIEKHCQPALENYCGARNPDQRNIILLADSRGLDIYMALKAAYPNANIQTSYANGCAPVFSADASFSPYYPNCFGFNKARLGEALTAPVEDVIFLAMNLDGWRQAAAVETVKKFRAAGKTVYILGEFSIAGNRSPLELAIEQSRFEDFSGQLENFLVDDLFSMDREFADEIRESGAIYVSNKAFLEDGLNYYRDSETGKLLSYDGMHLNIYGAKSFGLFLRIHYPIE